MESEIRPHRVGGLGLCPKLTGTRVPWDRRLWVSAANISYKYVLSKQRHVTSFSHDSMERTHQEVC